jgi:hypothetical protein
MTISDARREKIWKVLSDLFVDTEPNYEWMIPEIADVDLDLLKEIFYAEVAPCCGPNFMTPAPPIWAGFDTGHLVQSIREILENSKKSLFGRLKYKAMVISCRWYFNDIWKEFFDKWVEYNKENETPTDKPSGDC